jgi:hypothetical protein
VDQATLPDHTKDKNIFQSCQVPLAEGGVSISPIFSKRQQLADILTENRALVRRFSDGNQERSQNCQAGRLKLCYAMKKHWLNWISWNFQTSEREMDARRSQKRRPSEIKKSQSILQQVQAAPSVRIVA